MACPDAVQRAVSRPSRASQTRTSLFAQAVARRDAGALTALQKSVENAAAELERSLAEQLDRSEIPAEAQVSLRKLKFLSKVAADIAAAIAEIDD